MMRVIGDLPRVSIWRQVSNLTAVAFCKAENADIHELQETRTELQARQWHGAIMIMRKAGSIFFSSSPPLFLPILGRSAKAQYKTHK